VLPNGGRLGDGDTRKRDQPARHHPRPSRPDMRRW
jgi:hypothetical protein